MKLKSKIAMTAIAAALMGVSGAASATAFAGSPTKIGNPGAYTAQLCDNWSGSTFAYIDCSGWWKGNLLTGGTVGSGDLLSGLQALDPTITSATPYLEKVGSLLSEFSSRTLNGISIIGFHYGNSPFTPAANTNSTILLKINATTPFVMTKEMVEQQGLSGYAVFQTVPTPGTIALLGLGMLGLGAARRKLV